MLPQNTHHHDYIFYYGHTILCGGIEGTAKNDKERK